MSLRLANLEEVLVSWVRERTLQGGVVQGGEGRGEAAGEVDRVLLNSLLSKLGFKSVVC